jgi:hypothetical protein
MQYADGTSLITYTVTGSITGRRVTMNAYSVQALSGELSVTNNTPESTNIRTGKITSTNSSKSKMGVYYGERELARSDDEIAFGKVDLTISSGPGTNGGTPLPEDRQPAGGTAPATNELNPGTFVLLLPQDQTNKVATTLTLKADPTGGSVTLDQHGLTDLKIYSDGALQEELTLPKTWTNGETSPTTLYMVGSSSSTNLQSAQGTLDLTYKATLAADGIEQSIKDTVGVNLLPIEIKPDDGVAGVVGDMVPSNNGATGEKHFVSPKKSAEIPNDYVTLKAEGPTKELFESLLEWEGGEAVPDEPLKRRIKRDTTGKTVFKVKVKNGVQEAAKVNVWVVWCDGGPPQNVGAATTSSSTTSGSTGSPQAGASWVIPASTQRYFEFTVLPATMITDTEVPKFEGEANVNPPPGPAVTNSGANTKWDVSRRIRIKHENPAPTSITRNQIWGSPNHSEGLDANAAGFPSASLEVLTYPSDLREGNDDRGPHDEDNNPYSDAEVLLAGHAPAAKGKLASQDKVTSPFILQTAGVNGETTLIKVHFGEFVRLEIGTGSTARWYKVSDFTDWKVEQRFQRNASNMTDSRSSVGDDNSNY